MLARNDVVDPLDIFNQVELGKSESEWLRVDRVTVHRPTVAHVRIHLHTRDAV